jgi:hypothetical protein
MKTLTPNKKVLTHNLLEPLHGAKTAKFDINTGTGNLTIDRLNAGEGLLASGSLEFLDKQAPPAWTVDSRDNQAALTLKASGGRQPGFHFPWQACNGETNWQIHLNPTVLSDITARSGGGNVRLDLAGMAITQVSADSGGGNMDVVLPDGAANLSVLARTGGGNVNVEIGNGTTGSNTVNATSGAGNVVIGVPSGVAAYIHASTGLGKVIVDSRFSQIDKNTYQSPDFDTATDKVEVTAKSGAGNVSINTK